MVPNFLNSLLVRNLMNSFNRLSNRLDLRKFGIIFSRKQVTGGTLKDVCGFEEVHFDVRLRKTKKRIPTVLTKEEVAGLLQQLESRYQLAAQLQYGAGLRLSELVNLRTKDIDLKQGMVTIRGGKGDKDRTSIIPNSLRAPPITSFRENAPQFPQLFVGSKPDELVQQAFKPPRFEKI